MIAAIDYGSCWIRSVFRNPQIPERLTMHMERSEYAMMTDTAQHRHTLDELRVPYAECEGSLVVPGNHAEKIQWLSRVPRTPLLSDGCVPSDDPPARQMLHVITQAILPPASGSPLVCAITVPGPKDTSVQAAANEEFLCRLIRMNGFRPLVVNPAEAVMLATGSDATFTGLSIVMGAETTTIGVMRYGMLLSTETVSVGGSWIDTEMARQFGLQVWDQDGSAYLDLDSIRRWKMQEGITIHGGACDRERTMERLYSIALKRISGAAARLLMAAPVKAVLDRRRIAVIVSGGAAGIDGFLTLLTESFIDHDIAGRISSVRDAGDPDTAVVRGALIAAELESRSPSMEDAA